MKNKVLALMVTAVMVCSMAACSGKAADGKEAGKQASAENVETTQSAPEATTDSADAASSEDVKATGEFTFDLPEGFVKDEENSTADLTMYYGPNYPDELSNINLNVLANDGSFSQLTPEMLVTLAEQQIKQAYSIEVDMELMDSKTYKVGDCDALRYEISYDLGEGHMHQIQVIVQAPEKLYFVTFSLAENEDYLDAFNACADTIRFE